MQRIADGVWQLDGFPRDLFNVYLMEDILIDAATRWARSRILRQLPRRPPRLVALTHCHPDHQGAVRAVCERYHIGLACHEADAAAAEGRAPMVPNHKLMRLGVRVWAGPPYPVERGLRDGDEVAGFRVVHTPGHTPGHVVFFHEADRLAIAGDVLANIHFLNGQAGLREPPPLFTQDPAQNWRSVQLLAALQPKVVCFGHGPPLREPELLERFVAQRTLRRAVAASGKKI